MGKNMKDPSPANTSQVSDMLKLSRMSLFTVMALKINSFVLPFLYVFHTVLTRSSISVSNEGVQSH